MNEEVTLEELKKVISFKRDDDGIIILTRVDCHIIGNFNGDLFGNHVGCHEGTHIGYHKGDHIGDHIGNSIGIYK